MDEALNATTLAGTEEVELPIETLGRIQENAQQSTKPVNASFKQIIVYLTVIKI